MQSCDCCCRHGHRAVGHQAEYESDGFMKSPFTPPSKEGYEHKTETTEITRKANTFSIDAILSREDKVSGVRDKEQQDDRPDIQNDCISKSSFYRRARPVPDVIGACCSGRCISPVNRSSCRSRIFSVYHPSAIFEPHLGNHYQRNTIDKPTMVPIGKQRFSPNGCTDCSYPDMRRINLGHHQASMTNDHDMLPHQDSMLSINADMRRSKRKRTIFTAEQLDRLEQEFQQQQYVVGQERKYLAVELGLNEIQVKVWFQNRRIKWRKQKCSRLPQVALQIDEY